MPENCVLLARRNRLKSLVKPAVLLALMLWAGYGVYEMAADQYRWQWYRVWRYIGTWEEGVFRPGALLYALLTTLKLTAAGMAFALPFGAALAGMRLSASPVARAAAAAVLGLLRNTPLLMQM